MLGALALLAELLFDAVAIGMMVTSMAFLRSLNPMTDGTFGATYEPYNAYGSACGGLLFGTGLASFLFVLPYMLRRRIRNTVRRWRLSGEPWNGGTVPGATAGRVGKMPRTRRINRWFFT